MGGGSSGSTLACTLFKLGAKLGASRNAPTKTCGQLAAGGCNTSMMSGRVPWSTKSSDTTHTCVRAGCYGPRMKAANRRPQLAIRITSVQESPHAGASRGEHPGRTPAASRPTATSNRGKTPTICAVAAPCSWDGTASSCCAQAWSVPGASRTGASRPLPDGTACSNS